MGFKEILAQGLIDGIGGFIDSIVNQIDEQSEYAVTKELLNMHEENLEKIKLLLETIGGDGKFEEFGDADELWSWAILISSIVSGIDLEDSEFEELREIRDAAYADLITSWKQTKAFLKSDVCLYLLNKMENKENISNVGVAIDNLFNDIATLSYNKNGLFAKRKLKKMINFYSETAYMECNIYKIIIATVRNTLE